MWVVQFINTAIILLLVNNRLKENSIVQKILMRTGLSEFMFNGEYEEFNASWYGQVGVAIALACIINTIAPIFNTAFACLASCKRCLDRSCRCDARRTRQMLQDDYESLYTGGQFEIDNRYSVLISNFFIVMMYSSTIPILYFGGFLLCITQYWTDKAMMLMYHRSPPKYGLDLATRSRRIIEWSIILHLFMGLYMMSNPDIFPRGEDENEII